LRVFAVAFPNFYSSFKEISIRKQTGFSLIELFIVVAIILILAAIAISNLLKARISANEPSAVGTMRSVNTAVVQYSAQCPNLGFPANITVLGPGPGDCTGAGIIDAVLVTNTKSGYNFANAVGATNAAGVITTYTYNANPINRGITGQCSFFLDQTGVIRYNQTAAAGAGDSALQ
jgi:type IV pilus assembly protein PilA